MRFPGRRKRKHFFPVTGNNEPSFREGIFQPQVYDVVGLDQTILDIVYHCDEKLLSFWGIPKKGSVILTDERVHEIYTHGIENNLVQAMYAGGAIGNTLHNYSVLSGRRSLLLGTLSKTIVPFDATFRYMRTTSGNVAMECMQLEDGPIGRAITFITPDGERSFAIAPGISNHYHKSSLPTDAVQSSSFVLASLFLFRNECSPIYEAQYELIRNAFAHGIPVGLSLGLSHLVREKRQLVFELLEKYVTVAAMNREESFALTEIENPILALEAILELVDFVLITDGKNGVYIGAYVDDANKRETDYEFLSDGIANHNRYEYSRVQRRQDCAKPIKIYTHVNPYMGGPAHIVNTNGAGDSALAAVIHDICANNYSRKAVPDSEKHSGRYLTYSSIAQIARYANSVSYEVLKQESPRLESGEGLSDATSSPE